MTEQAAAPSATNAIKKKMSGKDWGPKAILATPDETRKLFLGTLLGQANDITNVTSPEDELLEGLKGRFIFKPADTAKAKVASYILWLPSGMGGELFDLPRKKQEVEFAFHVWVQKAQNPAGYEWVFVPLVAAAESDPLAALEARVAGAPMIAPPTPEMEPTVNAVPDPAADVKEPEPAKAEAPAPEPEHIHNHDKKKATK